MSNNHRATDLPTFLNDLDGGVFADKVARALSDVAAGVVDTDKKGKLTLTFDIERIGNSYQVSIDHKLSFKVPTNRGNYSQEDTTKSALHVNTGGRLTVFPENQHQIFDRQGNPARNPQDQE